MRVGIVHPGQMGASVAAAARAGGAEVSWASEGRSPASAARARAAELHDAGSVSELVAASEVIVSVCPPDHALDLAAEVAAHGFGGVYVDANAVSPATVGRIAAAVEAAGARCIDGGIVGPPAKERGTTRLYLSGAEASVVAALFDGSALEAIVIDGDVGLASALKMAYAAWTKGSSALLMAVRALAAAEGVTAPLLSEWAKSQPGLEDRSERTVRSNAFKAWRFAGEMAEIADTFAAVGLPDGMHRGAEEVYRRLAGFKDADPAPSTAEVVRALLNPSRRPAAEL